jgi:hypothetical protein
MKLASLDCPRLVKWVGPVAALSVHAWHGCVVHPIDVVLNALPSPRRLHHQGMILFHRKKSLCVVASRCWLLARPMLIKGERVVHPPYQIIGQLRFSREKTLTNNFVNKI